MVLEIIMISSQAIRRIEECIFRKIAASMCGPIQLLDLLVQLPVQRMKVVIVITPDLFTYRINSG